MAAVLRAFVVHWDAAGLDGKVDLVAACGVQVVGAEHSDGGRALRQVKDLKPDLLVVWLGQRVGDGRVTAAAIRSYGWASELAVLFVEDAAEPLSKSARAKLQEVLPDAIVVVEGLLPVWLAKVKRALLERRRPIDAAAS
jgi:DNA-binding NarL/FixJ family response regulator